MFAYRGARLLDGRLYVTPKPSALTAQLALAGLPQYTVLAASTLKQLRPLRFANVVHIVGLVAAKDVGLLATGLQVVWRSVQASKC